MAIDTSPGLSLADRVTLQGWTLVQVADGLGIDRNTVSDRLNAYGLRHTRQTAR